MQQRLSLNIGHLYMEVWRSVETTGVLEGQPDLKHATFTVTMHWPSGRVSQLGSAMQMPDYLPGGSETQMVYGGSLVSLVRTLRSTSDSIGRDLLTIVTKKIVQLEDGLRHLHGVSGTAVHLAYSTSPEDYSYSAEWADRSEYGPSGRPTYGSAWWRHGLDRMECLRLGRMVSAYMTDTDFDECGHIPGLDDISSFLTDASAHDSVLYVLPSSISRGIVFTSCGHFDSSPLYGRNSATCVCQSCADLDDWVRCEDDGQYHDRDEVYYSERGDGYYTYDRDGESYYEDDDDERHNGAIHSWATNAMHVLNRPSVVSSASGEFTIGMEFECEPWSYSSRNELAEHVADELAGKAMCKLDGSLSDTGLEVVLAPMTLEQTKEVWLNLPFPSGTQAWNVGSCGTHVHIDSRAFTPLSLAKFMAFWCGSENASLIRRVAGRHPSQDSQAREYAAIDYDEDAASIVAAMKGEMANISRYRAVNLTTLSGSERLRLSLPPTGDSHHGSYNTVELRIFRASLRKERTLAQLEMAHASVIFAREGSCADMSATAFIAWLGRRGRRYSALCSYLGVQRPHKDKPCTLGGSSDEGTVSPELRALPASNMREVAAA